MIHITFSIIFNFFFLQDNSFPQVAVLQRVLLIIWFINNSYIRYISLTYSLHNRFNEPFNMRLPSLCYYSIQRVWLFFRWNKLSLYKHVYLWDFFIYRHTRHISRHTSLLQDILHIPQYILNITTHLTTQYYYLSMARP